MHQPPVARSCNGSGHRVTTEAELNLRKWLRRPREKAVKPPRERAVPERPREQAVRPPRETR